MPEARGQRANESQIRRQRTIQQTGFTPWQLWKNNQVSWLMANGFTPQSTGWSWNRLIKVAPRLRYMNNLASPGAQITPDLIAEAMSFERTQAIPSEWTWERINEKYTDIYEYREHNNRDPGRMHYFQDRISEMPVQWWFYH
jgi:hypothetical protein